MGLLENELKEIRELMSDFRSEKVDIQTYKALISGYKETHNRVSTLLKIMALMGQYPEIVERIIRATKLVEAGGDE